MRRSLVLLLLLAVCACEVREPAPAPATARVAAPHEPWPRVDPLFARRHADTKALDGRRAARLVFLGDSITRGWVDAGAETWAHYYAPRGALNFGVEGDRTQNVLWRITDGAFDGMSPELLVLMIGTNNLGTASADAIAAGVDAVLAAVAERLPKTRVLVLAVLPRHISPWEPWPADLTRLNDAIRTYARARRAAFVDLSYVFVDAAGTIDPELMPDTLHPSAAGYRRMAAALEPTFDALLGRLP